MFVLNYNLHYFQSMKSSNWKKSSEINNGAIENLFALKTLKERQSISDEDLSLGLAHVILEGFILFI